MGLSRRSMVCTRSERMQTSLSRSDGNSSWNTPGGKGGGKDGGDSVGWHDNRWQQQQPQQQGNWQNSSSGWQASRPSNCWQEKGNVSNSWQPSSGWQDVGPPSGGWKDDGAWGDCSGGSMQNHGSFQNLGWNGMPGSTPACQVNPSMMNSSISGAPTTDCSVWVENLPADIGEDALKYVFGTYGKIENVEIMSNSSTNQASATVEYAAREEVETAILTLNEKYEIRAGYGPIKVSRSDLLSQRYRAGPY